MDLKEAEGATAAEKAVMESARKAGQELAGVARQEDPWAASQREAVSNHLGTASILQARASGEDLSHQGTAEVESQLADLT